MKFNVGSDIYVIENYWFGAFSFAVFCEGKVIYKHESKTKDAFACESALLTIPQGNMKIQSSAQIVNTAFNISVFKDDSQVVEHTFDNSIMSDLKTTLRLVKNRQVKVKLPLLSKKSIADVVFEFGGCVLTAIFFIDGDFGLAFVSLLLTIIMFFDYDFEIENNK